MNDVKVFYRLFDNTKYKMA